MNPPPSPQAAADSTPPLRLAGHTLDLVCRHAARLPGGALVAMLAASLGGARAARAPRRRGRDQGADARRSLARPRRHRELADAGREGRARRSGRTAATRSRRSRGAATCLAPDAPRARQQLRARRDALRAAACNAPVRPRRRPRRIAATLAQHRLVTVLGTGGIGKTAFALAAAHGWIEREEGPAAWVYLAPISDPTLIPATLAHALGVAVSQSDRSAARTARGSATACEVGRDRQRRARRRRRCAHVRAVLDARARPAHCSSQPGRPCTSTASALFRLAPLAVPRPDEASRKPHAPAAVALFPIAPAPPIIASS